MKHGLGIKSLVRFINDQTFCGRTWTLNVSKTLIMNAKLKFDLNFLSWFPTTKINFYMNMIQQKRWNWKRQESVSNLFSIWIKKADLWNTVHNIPRFNVTCAIFGIPFIWKHSVKQLLKRLWVSSQSVLYISSRLSGTFELFEDIPCLVLYFWTGLVL